MNAPAPIGQKDRTLTRIDAAIAHLTALRMDTARTGFAWDSEHMLGAIDAASELFEGDDLNEARQCAVDSLGDDSDGHDPTRSGEYADHRHGSWHRAALIRSAVTHPDFAAAVERNVARVVAK